MSSEPFIHTFRTSEECYFYDVNKDKIIGVSEGLYEFLSKRKTEICKEEMAEIDNLINAGYLSANRVKISEHPVTPYVKHFTDSRLVQIILQVTQSCNLRCNYCIYSGGYKQRTHSQKQMGFDIARKAVDYLFMHSRDTDRVVISFYGGEPLLNFDLIKEVIKYVETEYFGKTVQYNLTTNGTLLSEEIIDYVVSKDISIMFSLDGPANIHDRYRRFTKDNSGSYDKLMNAVYLIQKLYPDYFIKKISFNTVLDSKNNFSCVNEFVMGESILKDNVWNASLVNHLYKKNEDVQEDNVFWMEREYEFFKVLLSAVGKYPVEMTSKLLRSQFDSMDIQYNRMQSSKSSELPEKSHHGGPCVPGAMKLFVTAEGNLFPCERVSEVSNAAKIGNIFEGLNLKKVEYILNIERASSSKCISCWAYRHCVLCIASADNLDEVSEDEIVRNCVSAKHNFAYAMRTMCSLKEVGYKT